ncbi:MAG: zinc-binding dehydrogenase [Rhodospirillaceae bacterium]|nr:zinc-binding dehydrogenase [Rhodospirillaceae bacterium]
MRSVVHSVFGDPVDVLKLTDVPMPAPAAGQVRLRMKLAAIHNHDLWTVRGSYGYKPALPAIGGSEAVGVVDAVGEGVDVALIGKRMAYAGVRGAWAEYYVASAVALVPVPDVMSDEAAAQLIAMPFSALTLLDFLNVAAGDWIIQNAANGAVGTMLAGLAKSRGIHCVNLVRRDEGVAEMAKLGISNTVSTAAKGWKDSVRSLVGDGKIRAGVDSIGARATEDMAALLAESGLLVSFGSMTGEPMQLSSGTVIFKQLTLKGFWASTVSAQMLPEKRKSLMGELIRLVATGEVKLHTDAVFDLADITKAVTRALTPGRAGKVLLKP